MSERDSQNELIRIYSQLQGKRSNLPIGSATPEQAGGIDSLIDRAASVRNEDLDEFKFRDSDIQRPPFAGRTGGVLHVDLTTYCERIDSFLGYLRGTLPAEAVGRIGYTH